MQLDMLFKVIGGLGIFLFGMENMSSGMQKLAGKRLKRFLAVMTTNRIVGIFMGIIVTILVQSSSVSTVMTVGFVNASLLTLKQALGVIFGANIGTTTTGWLLALDVAKYGLPILGASAIAYMFSKSDKAKTRALTCMGLGMIFFGLELMSKGLAPIRDLPEFVELFHRFSADTYFGMLKVVLIGAGITAVVQSSAATLGITITLAVQGLIDYPTAVALVLGENIGTTITSFLATLNANVNAKRAAYAHTIINIFGVIWVTSIFPYYLRFLDLFSNPETNVGMAIATAHTIFNVSNIIVLTPFIGILADFLCKIVKDDGKANERITKIDTLITKNSNIIVEQSMIEVETMGNIIKKMFQELAEVYKTPSILTDTKVQELGKMENDLDLYQVEITDANFNIFNNNDMTPKLRRDVRNTILVSDEYETVSDYLMRIANNLKKLYDNMIVLAEEEKEVILQLHRQTTELFEKVNKAYLEKDSNGMRECLFLSKETTALYREGKKKYIDFGVREEVTTMASTNYMDIINFYRRVGDHLTNIIEGYTEKY